MTILAIRHSAFVVRNIDVSLRFYCEILDLKIYMRKIEEGLFIDRLTGLTNVRLEWVKLIIPKGGLIELLQYHSHPDKETYSPATPSPAYKLGCSHVALTASNLSDLYNSLVEAGYSCLSEPLVSSNGKVKILYAHDPDGSIIELIEDL